MRITIPEKQDHWLGATRLVITPGEIFFLDRDKALDSLLCINGNANQYEIWVSTAAPVSATQRPMTARDPVNRKTSRTRMSSVITSFVAILLEL